MQRTPTDLLYGTLDVLVLKTLSWQSMHGYAISNWIRQQTDGALEIDDAALYKSLHRLERQRLIAGEWGVTENNRRAKFYRLTPRGRAQFRAESSTWSVFSQAVSKVLTATTAPA